MSVIPLPVRDADEVRDRAIRLFTFLREYTELRARTILSTDTYDEVIWLADVPKLPGCFSAAFEPANESEVWLELQRPGLRPPPPPPPPDVEPWLDRERLADSGQLAPPLRDAEPPPETTAAESPPEIADAQPLAESIDSEPPPESIDSGPPPESIDGEPSPETADAQLPPEIADAEPRPEGADAGPAPVALEMPADVRAEWEVYVRRQWMPWAERDRVLQQAQRIYTDIFRIHQTQQRLGEAYEVVMGIGHLTWRTPSGFTVSRHVLVAQADVRFDADRGVITVSAAADGARPVLEQDMLEPDERPPRDVLDAISADLASVGDDIFADRTIVSVVRRWAHGVAAGGRFEENLDARSEVTGYPCVRLAPALILRRRSERSIGQALANIADQLRMGAPVPEGVRRLVDLSEPPRTSDEEPEAAPEEELLFPLPANEAQLEVIRRLRDRPGVLVQGPPGTGKSHTIANLVTHLLAHGERVLVTSHTARALEVLRDRIPAEVRELAVVVLGNDARGHDELQASVRGISERYATWSPRRSLDRIARCREELARSRAAEAELRQRFRDLREQDCRQHTLGFGGYTGSAQDIARQLRSRAPELGWFPDAVDPDLETPLTDAETAELLGLLRSADPEAEAQLQTAPVEAASLPHPEAFARLVEEELSATAAQEELAAGRSHGAFALLAAAPPQAADALADAMATLRRQRLALTRRRESWLAVAAEQVAAGMAGRWRTLERTTADILASVRPLLPAAGCHVTGLEGRDLVTVRADATVLNEHLQAGGGLGVGPLRPPPVRRARYLVDRVRVDGMPCRDSATLARLIAWAYVQERLDRLDVEWSPHRPPATGSAAARCSEYEDLAAALASVLRLEEARNAAARAAGAVPGLVAPDWGDEAALGELEQAIEACRRQRRLRAVRRQLEEAQALLSVRSGHPVVRALREAVVARDQQAYAPAYDSLERLDAHKAVVRRRQELMGRLQAAVPQLAARLGAARPGPAWDTRAAAFSAAWDWARAHGWLAERADPTLVSRLERDLDDARQRIERATRALAAELAWSHCLDRLSQRERAHLETWEESVRKIGKGTGKHAARWRMRAREAMQGCRSAIPAWIMPIFKVAEAVDMAPEAFDVVIVDEASQSGPEALFLQYLARKVIVVGDDQQISPENVGVDRDKVQFLNTQYLHDVPLAMHYDADTSYFTHAAIRYGDRVALQEHFRCMPEIIQFSNRLCYQDRPLVPLRQYGTERLRPSVQVRHVEDGVYDAAQQVNEPEARAIVEQIVACRADRAYAGKTFGVISLVGTEQARLIGRLLAEQVEPAEMERRRLLCGDAYAFQGDERDVMFLSLVQAPREGHRLYAATSSRDRRRFNVAASRARDQLWLFHTATLDDLHPGGVTHRLLRYCMQPRVEPVPADGLAVEAWRRRAAERRPEDVPPHPFDNWLELDVFLRLVDRGYRVIPHHDVAGYQVDLLVEGSRGRLAVACDGDRWPGAEALERDLVRERMLERCGLPFSRVRGPAFYRDPDAALEPVWADLRQHGIEPEPLVLAAPQAACPAGQVS